MIEFINKNYMDFLNAVYVIMTPNILLLAIPFAILSVSKISPKIVFWELVFYKWLYLACIGSVVCAAYITVIALQFFGTYLEIMPAIIATYIGGTEGMLFVYSVGLQGADQTTIGSLLVADGIATIVYSTVVLMFSGRHSFQVFRAKNVRPLISLSWFYRYAIASCFILALVISYWASLYVSVFVGLLIFTPLLQSLRKQLRILLFVHIIILIFSNIETAKITTETLSILLICITVIIIHVILLSCFKVFFAPSQISWNDTVLFSTACISGPGLTTILSGLLGNSNKMVAAVSLAVFNTFLSIPVAMLFHTTLT